MKVRYRDAFELAAKLAANSTMRQKIGAVITDKFHNLLGVGFNILKTHPLQAKFGGDKKIYMHAEISALRQCKCGDPYNIYVVRLKSDGSLALARPCGSCCAALDAFGVTNIHWSE